MLEDDVKYMLILAAAEDGLPTPGSPQWDAYFHGFMAFHQELMQAGSYLGGEPLMPAATATTVRQERGQTMTTDGPFAETKEQIGGVYILECRDLDDALAWAKKVPYVTFGLGSVEVRPCLQIDMPA
jgi:hypothetical protein